MSFLNVELGGQRVRVRESVVWICSGCGKAIRIRMERQVELHRRICAQLRQLDKTMGKIPVPDWLQPGYDDGNPEYESYTAAFGNWHVRRRG